MHTNHKFCEARGRYSADHLLVKHLLNGYLDTCCILLPCHFQYQWHVDMSTSICSVDFSHARACTSGGTSAWWDPSSALQAFIRRKVQFPVHIRKPTIIQLSKCPLHLQKDQNIRPTYSASKHRSTQPLFWAIPVIKFSSVPGASSPGVARRCTQHFHHSQNT